MPSLTSKVSSYTTTLEDMWDIVSLRVYGNEHAMHHVQDANFDYRFVDAFQPDIVLSIPSPVFVQYNLNYTQTKIPDIGTLLPWR